jgi:hypothetical protein
MERLKYSYFYRDVIVLLETTTRTYTVDIKLYLRLSRLLLWRILSFVMSYRSLQTFRKNVLPPSWGPMSKPSDQPVRKQRAGFSLLIARLNYISTPEQFHQTTRLYLPECSILQRMVKSLADMLMGWDRLKHFMQYHWWSWTVLLLFCVRYIYRRCHYLRLWLDDSE